MITKSVYTDFIYIIANIYKANISQIGNLKEGTSHSNIIRRTNHIIDTKFHKLQSEISNIRYLKGKRYQLRLDINVSMQFINQITTYETLNHKDVKDFDRS